MTDSPTQEPPQTCSPKKIRYEIRDSTLGGQGVFTAEAIPFGTIIISEAPLLRALKSGTDFYEKYHALDPQSRQKFLALYNQFEGRPLPNEEQIPIEAGIWFTNRFSVSKEDSAIFESVSRVNHSCQPNTLWVWKENLGHMVVATVKDFEQGEEVFISYMSFGKEQDLPYRREKLAHWNFVCCCERCVSESRS